MKAKHLLTVAAALLLAAQVAPTSAKPPLILSGTESSERVNELTTEMTWYHSLAQAEDAARRQGKMVFWVQMLGDIAGAT